MKHLLGDKIQITEHRVKSGPPNVADYSIACFVMGNTRPFRETLPGLEGVNGNDNPFALSDRLIKAVEIEEKENRSKRGN